MVRRYAVPLVVACVACVPPLRAAEAVVVVKPAYQIVLRSRDGEVAPERFKDGQTTGGYIDVVQSAPDTVLFMMRGAVVAGAEQHKGGEAAMKFELNQDFEVVPTRAGVRTPRLTVVGVLVGTLQSTPEGGGTATQGPACAAINAAGQPVVKFCMKPHAVTCGQKLFVNEREGPLEVPVVPGPYCLNQTFEISAAQAFNWCAHPGNGAAADFTPEPRFDARWNNVLKPFRAVPHRDFGFGVLVRVVEDVPPLVVVPGSLPPARRPEQVPPPRPAEPTHLPPEAGPEVN